MRFSLIIVFTLLFNQVYSQWVQTNGPFGGSILPVVKHDSVLFAGTKHGVYRSSNGGDLWEEANNGLPVNNTNIAMVKGMIADHSGVYVSIWDAGIFKTTDNGNSWSTLLYTTTTVVQCFDTVGTDVFAGTYGEGILFSSDSGATWDSINNGLTNLKILTIAHWDSLLFAGTYGGGIFMSYDYGANWISINNGIPDLNIEDIIIYDGKIFAGSPVKVYVSSDTGATWNISLPGLSDGVNLAIDGSTLYCGSTNGPFFSNDTGITWNLINNNSLIYGQYINVWDGVIYLGNGRGLFISTDHGNTWIPKSTNIIRSGINSFLDNGPELWCGSATGSFRTLDAGNSWDSILYNGAALQGGGVLKYANYVFAKRTGALMRSSDNGNNWSVVYPNSALNLIERNGDLLANISDTLIMSSDSGSTWTVVNSSIPQHGFALAADSAHLYLGTYLGIYISTDDGITWTAINNGLPVDPFVDFLYVKGTSIFSIVNYFVYRSDDFGQSWVLKNTGSGPQQFNHLLFNGNEIYGSTFNGVYISMNNGNSWSTFANNLPVYAKTVNVTVIHNDTLYAGTLNAGCWAHPMLHSLISGKVFVDSNANCIADPGEAGMSRFAHSYWMVKASKPGSDFYSVPDTDGTYYLKVDDGNFDVSMINPTQVYSVSCPVSNYYNVTIASAYDSVSSIDFGTNALMACSRMRTFAASTVFRPCLSSVINVAYCNEGTIDEGNAILTVHLPLELTVTGSSIPWTSVSGNSYTYNIGLVHAGDCGLINLTADVLCDPAALVNATLCIRSEISPAEFCQPVDSTWDNSSVSVDGECINDSLVCFTITNNGSGDMQGPSDWRLYADNLLVQQGTFQILAGQDTTLCFAATGQTFRFEADQRPNHPGNSHPNTSIERCGPVQVYSLGQILLASVNSGIPFESDYCALVRTSWDPNEKSVVPTGSGSYHLISANERLEYKIDFQNTGNDTAFVIVIRDTIDPDVLDLNTLDLGIASHPFTFSIEGRGVLVWRFDNILLADSNINESLSHGYVSFSITAKSNLISGTQIKNTANIYFDFNPPVITNTTLNTVCVNIPPTITYNGIQLETGPGVIYQWYYNGAPINGGINPTLNPILNGFYHVSITDAYGCTSVSDTFNLLTVSIPSLSNKVIAASVYPNPVNSVASVIFRTELPGKVEIKISNISGQVLQRIADITATKNEMYEVPFGTSDLNPGVYLISIRSGEAVSHLRVVVIR